MIYIHTYIYIYIYVEGHVAELKPPHTQSVSSLREKMFKLRELGKKGYIVIISIKKKIYIYRERERDIYIYIYIVFLELK